MGNNIFKILAIDDNKDNLVILKALIHDEFPEAVVITAQSGRQGLELAAAQDPDIIFLDIIMPGIDGYEVCSKLKKDQKLCDIPVVFITAIKGDKESRIKALESGAEAFIAKPIDEIELTAQIRAMMKIRASNIQKRNEKELLASLVEEKTRELKNSNKKTVRLLDAVKREQTLIKAIFDSIPGYLYVYDENKKLIRWNRKHETMTGYSSEELSHMTLDQWFTPEDQEKVNKAVQDIYEKGYGEVEATLLLKNGKKMLTTSSGAPLVWDGHQYFAGIGVDITEQKKVQEAFLESQSIMEAAFENSQAGIAIADAPDGKLRYVNKAGLLIRNASKEEIVKDVDINRYVESWSILHFDGTPFAKEEVPLTRAILYGESCSDEFIIRRDNLEDRYVLAKATPIIDSNNNIKAGVVVFLDITERKIMEMQLRQNMDDLLESQRIAHLGTWRMDISTNQVVWSDELYRIFGLDSTIPPPPYNEHMKLFTLESWEKLSESLDYTRTSGIPYELELESVAADGNHGWIWLRGEAVKDSNGNITGLWGAVQDITERKIIDSRLLYLSYHDHLTDLHNRRYFEEELLKLDTKENLPLSIIMCDVNGLKLVNDSFGHNSGDELLKNVAKTIKIACRENDVIARIGGDEFVVVLPKTSADETVEIANHIKELASKEKVVNIELSISYGHETKTVESQSIIEVIANAENHMYRHKLYERSSIKSKTIDLIMNTLFEKSNREAKHSNRVSQISQAIASKMDFNKDAINQIRIAGLIHDIGKIGVDEKILNKPERLTIDERREIERHPEIGWRILSSTNEFSELAQFVLHHHEKWDGSGYPNGIIGEAIPIEARIIGVADAYDAMTSKRSYQKGMIKEDAINELKRCSGTQFDPGIVEVFINHVLTDTNEYR
jgi:diguanylate cyclase (GGDEF)-like protein/PAS domain S-box-containing protein